ncbi:MAG: PAS domain S-box protein [Spirochaetes bacterium]|jgi:PAS domain S-box-containing protein|nr:PAS domain S-box protein [Spirochaetota bacterium]
MTRHGAEQLLPLFERISDAVSGSLPVDQVVVARCTGAAADAPAAAVAPARRTWAGADAGPGAAAPVSRRTWSFLENLFANAPEGVIFADKTNRVLRVNAEFVRMFGYSAEEAVGRTIDELIAPEERFQEAQTLSRNVETGGFVRKESRRSGKDGSELDVSILGGPIFEDGQIVGIFAIYRDISERKHVEAAVEASLREKEVLLQEIHHRVKNNMQIISSILSLEIGNLSDPEVRQALQVSQNRIRSMALVHEKLYRSSDLARVDIAEYVSDLCSDLESLSADGSDLTLELDTDELHAGVDFAIPFGLIVNELVTNAIKHARPRSGRPVVKVRMRVSGDVTELVVSDNGPGLPPEFDAAGGSSLGLKLVQTLTAQLGGRLDFESADGAVMRVSLAPARAG